MNQCYNCLFFHPNSKDSLGHCDQNKEESQLVLRNDSCPEWHAQYIYNIPDHHDASAFRQAAVPVAGGHSVIILLWECWCGRMNHAAFDYCHWCGVIAQHKERGVRNDERQD